MISLILYSNIAKGLDCFTLNDVDMLRTNGLFICLTLLFILSSTPLCAQDSTDRRLPFYLYGQWSLGQGNRVYDAFPDVTLSCGLGWNPKGPFRLGVGFSAVRALQYEVASYRKLNGIGIQGGYMGKRLALQAEVGKMLQYEEGFADEGYIVFFQQDGPKGTYFRLSPMIRIRPFMAIHFSWYESTMVDGYLSKYRAVSPHNEEGRDQRFLRSFQGGLSFWL